MEKGIKSNEKNQRFNINIIDLNENEEKSTKSKDNSINALWYSIFISSIRC